MKEAIFTELPDLIPPLPKSDFLSEVAVASNLAGTLAELIPLSLAIALSPLSIIPGILMLHTPRPRPTGLSFLVGWAIGIAAITAVFVATSGQAGGPDKTSALVPFVRIGVGVALIGLGFYRWLTRHHSPHSPKWLRSMTSAGPARAFLTGIVLTLANVKVFFMCAAAGLVIAAAALGTTLSWTAVAAYTAIAVSSVAIPVLAYLVAGERLDGPLNRLNIWMEDNLGTLIACVLTVIGAVVLHKGIHTL